MTEGPSLPPAMAVRALGFAVDRIDTATGDVVLVAPALDGAT